MIECLQGRITLGAGSDPQASVSFTGKTIVFSYINLHKLIGSRGGAYFDHRKMIFK
jgi:hypothetical protein